jgi:predicted ATPase/class 3 adenylate cyclase
MAESGLPTGTVTFLFTDIEGSTKRWEEQPQAMQRALRRHDTILRAAIEQSGGYVFKTMGDAFCASFSVPTDAFQASLAAQQAISAEVWAEEIGELRVRMALHTGVAELQEGDYFGQPLNRVARLLSAGHGGQTLLSAATQELVRDSLPSGVELKDMGEHRLKDLTRPEHIFQLRGAGLLSEFPPLKTLDNRPNNLPAQLTPFIGREKEVKAACELLGRPEVRLVTFTGTGGTGKTRLAAQVAAELLDDFTHGIFFVELAALNDHSLVASSIAHAIGVLEATGRPIMESLKDYLRDKHLMIVLDNFEQVAQAAPVVDSLLKASPRVKVLVTSRLPLSLYGQREFPVSSLELPPVRAQHAAPLPVEQVTQYEAVRLFIERAQDVKPDFQVNNENAPAVAEICHRLDGLPLAIELAAARVRLFSPGALLSRLQSRLKMLTGGSLNLPARQQTLRNAIGWSYDLLGDGEKQLFRRMAVFQGGRTLEALEAICNSDGQLQIDVFDGAQSLVEKNLLQHREGYDGEPRFWMLETIHEFAREKLEESGEGDEMRQAHALFFLKLSEEAARNLTGVKQAEWLNHLEDEHDNLRAALDWCVKSSGDPELGLKFGSALWRFWARRGYYTEGEQWLERALGAGADAAIVLRAKALYASGVMMRYQGNYPKSLSFYQEALDLFREVGDKQGMAWALNDMGIVAWRQKDADAMVKFHEEALAIKREIGDERDIATSTANLAEGLRWQGDIERAGVLLEECMEIGRRVGDKYMLAVLCNNLGYVRHNQKDYKSARELFIESLGMNLELKDRLHIAGCMAGLAGIAAWGDADGARRAARLFGAIEPILAAISAVLDGSDRLDYERNVAAGRERLDQVEWDKAWQEGRGMTMEQAVQYALEEAGNE